MSFFLEFLFFTGVTDKALPGDDNGCRSRAPPILARARATKPVDPAARFSGDPCPDRSSPVCRAEGLGRVGQAICGWMLHADSWRRH